MPLPAGCVSYQFTGEIDNVVDPFGLLGTPAVGSVITGTITVNTNVQDLAIGSDNEGFYPGAAECTRVVFADREVTIVQEEFIPDPTLQSDDPGVFIENDLPEPNSPIPLFVDFVAGGPIGLALLDEFGVPPDQAPDGFGAFVYSYSKGCLQGFQTPCPPALLSDDSIPAPPASLNGLSTAEFSFNYFRVELPVGEAQIRGDLTSLETTTPVACPEPGFGSMLLLGLLSVSYQGAGPRKRFRVETP